jgi:predicted transcriptional regulator
VQVREVVDKLDLEVLAGGAGLQREVNGGYIADLLSCVMTRAQPGQLWFTLQTHNNIVAVASLTDVAAVVVAENAPVSDAVVDKAQEEGVVLLRSQKPIFETVSRLIRLND